LELSPTGKGPSSDRYEQRVIVEPDRRSAVGDDRAASVATSTMTMTLGTLVGSGG
jgi:hypothetical protein